MLEEFWDRFVIYVNAYYAIQEAQDACLRKGLDPAAGLHEFCSDANPFLWDGHSSAEPSVYEDFSKSFVEQFEGDDCSPQDGYAFSRSWLASMEGEHYGSELVASFDSITDLGSWIEACEAIARQLAKRAAFLERSPQDEMDMYDIPIEPAPSAAATHASEPEQVEPTTPPSPSAADIDAVIALLAKGDEAFAESLRARLASD